MNNNREKKFEIYHKIIEKDLGSGKSYTASVPTKWCCEKFYNYDKIEKIKFLGLRADKHGNEYPYVELLDITDDNKPEERSATITDIKFCMFCEYQFSPTGSEQTLYKHNQFFIP
jgi:hypothetical protein